MAYIFVSDGGPEADEYASNRIWFDERNPEDRRRAMLEAQRRREYIADKRASMTRMPVRPDSRPPAL